MCEVKSKSKTPIVILLVILVMSVIWASESEKITIEGTIVCADERGADTPCNESSLDFAIRSKSGARFLFSREDPKSKMFQDKRVRSRSLQVNAWRRSDGSIDIIKVFSIKQGVLHDVFYFCSVCNIKTTVGGRCWCCQDEFEFHEEPVARE